MPVPIARSQKLCFGDSGQVSPPAEGTEHDTLPIHDMIRVPYQYTIRVPGTAVSSSNIMHTGRVWELLIDHLVLYCCCHYQYSFTAAALLLLLCCLLSGCPEVLWGPRMYSVGVVCNLPNVCLINEVA